MLTRRKFIGAAFATAGVLALPLMAGESYQVGHQPWAGMPEAERDEFNAWLRSYEIDPTRTYRVDVDHGYMTVYQYHYTSSWTGGVHLASACGGSRDDVCRVPPFKVAL